MHSASPKNKREELESILRDDDGKASLRQARDAFDQYKSLYGPKQLYEFLKSNNLLDNASLSERIKKLIGELIPDSARTEKYRGEQKDTLRRAGASGADLLKIMQKKRL